MQKNDHLNLSPAVVPFFARRSMAATSIDGKLFFFAGVGANTASESILDVSDELWCYEPVRETWRQIHRDTPTAPWPSARRCVGWCTLGDSLRLWGGSGIRQTTEGEETYTFLNDEWQFDPVTEKWTLLRDSEDHLVTPKALDRPFPRYTPILMPLGNQLFLFSGYTEDRLGKRKVNDAWLGNFADNWECIPSCPVSQQGYDQSMNWPGLRYGAMSCTDNKLAYICGGFSDDGDHIDIWRFDPASREWLCLAGDNELNTPKKRYCGAMAFHENKLFLFGGRSRKNPKDNYNDLWCFDLKERRWNCLQELSAADTFVYDTSATRPAYHAKAAHTVCDGNWYLWGGEGHNGHVSDFWRFNFSSLQWQLIMPAREDDPCFW